MATISTSYKMIYLGQWAAMDNVKNPQPDAGSAERPWIIMNQELGSEQAPLYDQLVDVWFHQDTGQNAAIIGYVPIVNTFQQNPPLNWVTVSTQNSASRQFIDTSVTYWARITYYDGSSSDDDVYVRVIQLGNGQVYMIPPPHDDPQNPINNATPEEIEAITTQAIRSIFLKAYDQTNLNSVRVDRYGLNGAPFFICFGRGTLILTSEGQKPVETLRVGDLVVTADHGLQALRWIGSRKVSPDLLEMHQKIRPIRIKSGALGEGLPAQDLVVSPQHRMLVRSKLAQKLSTQEEVLVAAKHLCGIDGIAVAEDLKEVTYFHLLFDQHEIIIANGAEAESLYLGAQSLNAIGAEAREEIMAIFPDFSDMIANPRASRPLMNGRSGKQLSALHLQQNIPLVSDRTHSLSA